MNIGNECLLLMLLTFNAILTDRRFSITCWAWSPQFEPLTAAVWTPHPKLTASGASGLPPVIAGLQLPVVRNPRQCLKRSCELSSWKTAFSADMVTDPEPSRLSAELLIIVSLISRLLSQQAKLIYWAEDCWTRTKMNTVSELFFKKAFINYCSVTRITISSFYCRLYTIA